MNTMTKIDEVAAGGSRARISTISAWGAARYLFLLPYLLIFFAFVVYPIAYGISLGSNPDTYADLFADPIFRMAAFNTVVFVLVAVNIKMLLALLISGFFLNEQRWIKALGLIFILAWAVPSISTIFSIKWMLNPEWGMLNSFLFNQFQIMGPSWLTERWLAFGSAVVVHIWKYLPFWTLILLAGRMTIPGELYEAANVDGASAWQRFRFITFPSIGLLYVSATTLSMIWTLGDFNSIYLLTGGGPADRTQVLATLGMRYLRMDRVDMAIAAVIVAMPFIVPMMWFMMKYLSKESRT
ncbi:carbohydrate ABC transporter permease [Advenella sp. FME57]|uniref:carbohydrate ABC transporter permease n=1 Tax=Advenella sp. FME57 TaxID=2742604 RepID=UPI0018688B0D|nr:sugar ABC transporter permease [Advenella sp. FME57]